MTSRFMVRNYFELYRDITRGLKVTRKRPVKVQVLSIDELTPLLAYAKVNVPEAYACMVLQSLAGRWILEALNLCESDVDWQAETVEIGETSRPRPKNLYSFRTISVSPQVLDALRWEQERTNVKSAEGFILNHSRGGPHHHDNMGKRIRKLLNAFARETQNPNFARLRPRELRGTFVTLARHADVDERYLKRYVGHSPGDIMGTHYEAAVVDGLRRKVVDVFLGAYNGKLNAESEDDSCTSPRGSSPHQGRKLSEFMAGEAGFEPATF